MIKYKLVFEPVPKQLRSRDSVIRMIEVIGGSAPAFCPVCYDELKHITVSCHLNSVNVILLCPKCSLKIRGYARDIKVTQKEIVIVGLEVASIERES